MTVIVSLVADEIVGGSIQEDAKFYGHEIYRIQMATKMGKGQIIFF